MNRCALYRKEMALLISEPDRPQSPKQLSKRLREHLAQCPPCRECCHEIEALCLVCTSAAEHENTSLTPGFHEGWFRRIDRERGRPLVPWCAPFFQNWPVRAAIATLLLLLLGIPILHRPKLTLPHSPGLQTSAVRDRSAVSLLDYRLAASDAELDTLLRDQPSGPAPSRQSYTMLTRSVREVDY
jgi:hypothetical protein